MIWFWSLLAAIIVLLPLTLCICPLNVGLWVQRREELHVQARLSWWLKMRWQSQKMQFQVCGIPLKLPSRRSQKSSPSSSSVAKKKRSFAKKPQNILKILQNFRIIKLCFWHFNRTIRIARLSIFAKIKVDNLNIMTIFAVLNGAFSLLPRKFSFAYEPYYVGNAEFHMDLQFRIYPFYFWKLLSILMKEYYLGRTRN